MSALDDVAAAAARRDAAEAALTAAVAAARDAGEDVAAIARAAGVTRQTVYRWVSSVRDGTVVPVGRAIDDGLGVLATLVGPNMVGQVRAGLASADVRVKLRRWDLGWKNANGEAVRALGDDDRAVLDLAGKVVAKITRAIAADVTPLPHTVLVD